MTLLARLLIVFAVLCSGVAEASPFSARHAKYTTPTGTIYPLGVIAHDLASGDMSMHAVYDFQAANPGPRIGLTAAGSGTSGGTYDNAGFGKPSFTASSGSPTFSGLDLTGVGFYAINNGTAPTFTDVKFGAHNDCCYSIEIGQSVGGSGTGSPVVSASYCLAEMRDAIGIQAGGHSPAIQMSNSSTLSFDHCTFQNAPRDPIVIGLNQTLNLSNCYFKAYGTATSNGDHLEFIHALGGGTVNIDSCFFNFLDGAVSTPDGIGTLGGVTGAFQVQSDNGAAALSATHMLIYGTKTFVSHDLSGNPSTGVIGSLSCKAVNADVTFHVGHSVLQVGPTGHYVVITELNGHHCNIVNDGFVYDYDTGLLITSLS